MSKLLRRAKSKRQLAEDCYKRIAEDDIYLDDCCFNLQQCIEMTLKYLIEIHGGDYVKNHDIRAQLNVLNRMQINLPDEQILRSKASLLNSWEAESRYFDNFLACIADVEEVRELADRLLKFADSSMKKKTTQKMSCF